MQWILGVGGFLLIIAFWIFGFVQLAVGFIGIEHYFSSFWAWAALLIAIFLSLYITDHYRRILCCDEYLGLALGARRNICCTRSIIYNSWDHRPYDLLSSMEEGV